MIKKIIPYIIFFMMMSTAYASGAKTEQKLELLNNIGITDIDTDTLSATVISETKFMEYIRNLSLEEPVMEVTEFGEKWNIIDKNEKLASNGKVSQDKALKWLVRALGYDFELRRGRSADAVAWEIGLETSYSSKLSAEEVINLIYSALNVKIPEISTKNGVIGISTNGTGTVLSEYKKIEYFDGIVTATEETSLYKSEGVGMNRLEVDSFVYDTEYKYSPHVLGCGVRVYVYTGKNGEERIVYAEEKKNSRITVNSKDIINVSEDILKVEYEQNKRLKSVKLNPALRVVYNGRLYDKYTREDIIPDVGEIILSDTDNDGRYDIIFISSYETILVNSVSGEKIYNKFTYDDEMQIVDLGADKTQKVTILKDGKEISISEISHGMVLSVAKSKDEIPTIKIIVSDDVRSLYTKKIDKNNETVCFEGDEIKYNISKHYYDVVNSGEFGAGEIILLQEQDVYFDAFGNVFYVTYDKHGKSMYVYALKLYYNLDEEKSIIKFLDTDNKWNKIPCKDRVSLDGKKINGMSVYTALGGENYEPQLLTVKINNGEIAEINTAYETEDYMQNRFTVSAEATRYYSPRNKSFYCKHYIDADTKCFVIPSVHTGEEDDYFVSTVSFFVTGGTFTYKVYDIDEFNVAKAIVVRNTKLSNFTYIPLCVSKSITSLNADGEPVKYIVGNYGGTYNIPIPVDERYENSVGEYKAGDVILIKIDNGKIVNTLLKYSVSEGKKLHNPTLNDENALISSTPDYIQGIVKSIDTERRMVRIECGGELVIYFDKNVKMQSFTKGAKSFESSSMENMCVGDYVLVAVNNYKTDNVIIYKDF